MIKPNFNLKYGPYIHPGFLSFGSVSDYTLISPSFPYHIFDACLRLVE